MLNKRPSLAFLLSSFTLLAVMAQVALFAIHSHVTELVDDLVKSSISSNMLHSAIVLPIAGFFSFQIFIYFIFIVWVWFIANNVGDGLKLSNRAVYLSGIIFWITGFFAIFTLNNYFYPDSFFSQLMYPVLYERLNFFIMVITSLIMLIATIFALINSYLKKRNNKIRMGFLFLILASLFFPAYDAIVFHFSESKILNSKPNIILIGLDSVRPDFIGYFGNKTIKTPNINQFLNQSAVFTDNYTPLARTFPAWISILTAKHPIHSQARSNLSESRPILHNPTLAQKFKQAGYETIYATDEKRFSNITRDYGFDKLIGPHMGLNDFILAGLSDLPLTNLLINLPIGRILFPYNYANRAAAITYEPNQFLHLVKLGLVNRSQQKPLFFTIHLCVSHWPFTWARDKQPYSYTMAERYRSSVEEVDRQLGDVMHMLKVNGLLKNSLVVLLSDHGTSVGLIGDRIISEKNYLGDRSLVKKIPVYRFDRASKDSLDFKKDYSINTAIGQGTDLLSLKQYQTVLAFRGFGINIPEHKIIQRTSLLDIAPTLLEIFHLTPLKNIDGQSQSAAIFAGKYHDETNRPFYLETGYSISEIETSNIEENKIIHRAIGFYAVNPDGLIYVKPEADKLITRDKQRGIILGDWMLVRYPASKRTRLLLPHRQALNQQSTVKMKYVIYPSFYVLVNLKTKQWTIGLDTAFAKKAPVSELLTKLKLYYADEI